MNKQDQRDLFTFVACLARELGDFPPYTVASFAQELIAFGRLDEKHATNGCNRPITAKEKQRYEKAVRKMEDSAFLMGVKGIVYNPFSISVILPSGYADDIERKGLFVPHKIR